MNVTQISTEDRAAALVKARAYRAAANVSHDETDAATARAYRALAQGHSIIDIVQAFRETGLDERGRPRLAIARATWRRVHFEQRGHLGGMFSAVESWAIQGQRRRGGIVGTDHVVLYNDTFAEGLQSGRIWAHLPTIPPEHRPKHHLKSYFLLFEPVWSNIPRDPFLMRHLVGSLFVVLAAWNLTEIEMMVLRMIERERQAR